MVDNMHSMISTAVEDSLSHTAQGGVHTDGQLSEPLAEAVEQFLLEVKQAELSLRGVVSWASWRLLAWGLGVVAGLAVLWWLASSAVLWWDASAIGTAQVQKVQVEAELAGLRANQDALVKAGLLAKIGHCGEKKRLCVRVDESAGQFGEQSDYRIVRGY
jgi:hypothetical protein